MSNSPVAHTELTVGRAPVQVVEIQTQRCANRFGCMPCRAGVGDVQPESEGFTVYFAQTGVDMGYAAVNSTLARIAGGVQLTSTGANPYIQNASPATKMDGSLYQFCVVHGKLISGEIAETQMFWRSDGLGSFSNFPAKNRDDISFRGTPPLSELEPGSEFVAVFDASDDANFASFWDGDLINAIRFDFGSNHVLELYSVTFGTEGLFSKRGAECYNTRSTCQRLPDFRASPDGHMTPTGTYRDNDTIIAAEYDRASAAYFVAEVRPDVTPSGTVFAFGSSSNFAYLGFTGSDLVLAAGGNTAADQARATVAATAVAARTVTLVAEVDYSGDAVNLWEFDPSERALTLLASATAGTALPAAWAANTDGQIGTDGGNTYGSEDGGDFAGTVSHVRGHDGILFDGSAADQFHLKQYFSRPIGDMPADDDKAFLPYLVDVSTAPTKVSLAGTDRDTDPIGNRSSVTLAMTDHPSSDVTDDPYLSDRTSAPLRAEGTFWGKWRIRQRYGRVNARLRIFEGYRGQRLADMPVREYLLDKIDKAGRSGVTIRGRDILSKADLQKAQVPAQSPGLLNSNVTTGDMTITVKSATVDDYPAPGTIRINNEIMTFSAVTENAQNPALIEITLAARGTDRSEVAAHEADESVQLCRRYTNAFTDEVLTELLADDAGIDAQFLDLANWIDETDNFLSAYVLTALFTEPQSVASMVGTLMESVGAFIHWDEQSQLVRLTALKALPAPPPTITAETDIIADSFSITEKPREQATRVQVYYNPVSFTAQLRSPVDFLNGYIDADTDLEGVDGYGTRQIRTILSPWLTTNAQATQTASRLANRYQDVPVEVTFSMDAKDRSYKIGDVFRISHPQLVRADGQRDVERNFIIISADPVVAGEIVTYVAIDTTLAGFIYVIASNAQGDYTGDPDIDALYAFITDQDGRMSDGQRGAHIT